MWEVERYRLEIVGLSCSTGGGRRSKNTDLGKVGGGNGGGLPVNLEEILANHPTPQEGEEVVDLDWGHCRAVEEILQGSPQSH